MRLIDGADGMAVPELKRSALRALAEKAWKDERIQLLATLDESQADPALRLERLREHDLQRGTMGPLLMWTYRFDGCEEIIRTACDAARCDVASFCGSLAPARLCEIARGLIGFGEVPEGEPQAGGRP